MKTLKPQELHKVFIEALQNEVVNHSDFEEKPLLVDLRPPLPSRIRVYLFNATHPPGGRTLGEHKIQLIVPGQNRGQRANFDDSDGRMVILAGYEAETEVFILWDSGMYPKFSYSRNVQVRAETIYCAFAGKIGEQERYIRSQGKEVVITARKEQLADALKLRRKRTMERLMGVKI